MPTTSAAAHYPKILVFTAPSGAGKTTLVRHLLQKFPDQLAFSVSATTRPPRSYEAEGVDYYFLDHEAFRERINAGDFLEYEEVYANQFYGTLREEVARLWDAGKCVLFDVEVKGASAIKAAFPREARVVFVAPPTPEILFNRLRARGTEDDASLRKRIARAAEELNHQDRFDLVLVNDDLNEAKLRAEEIAREWLVC